MMKTIEEIREAAKKKLVGYTDKEKESFVQGAMFMAGELPQKRSEEWYQQQAAKKAEGAARSEAVCEYFKEVTGLGAAVDAMKGRSAESQAVDRAFQIFAEGLRDNPEYRQQFLDSLGARDMAMSYEILLAIKQGCRAFNERHDIQLGFYPDEENGGRWTFYWDEPV